jgi:hypothetical protein
MFERFQWGMSNCRGAGNNFYISNIIPPRTEDPCLRAEVHDGYLNRCESRGANGLRWGIFDSGNVLLVRPR